MIAFRDRFGGSTVTAAQVSYRETTLTENQVLQWPASATADNVLPRILQVNATGDGLSMFMPDAEEASSGFDFFVNNVGNKTFTLKDYVGNPVATIEPGSQKYLYLTDNTDPAGTWQVVLLGNTPSNIDAGGLAGAGLIALGATLNQSAHVSEFAGDRSVTAVDRAEMFLWQGGSGSLTLPLSSSVNDFFIEIRNQGGGVLTVLAVGGETIDGSGSIALQVGESCFVHAGTGAWYTVGRGRSTSFAFTQLVKTVDGGVDTLTLTEAANVVQTYNGTLLSAEEVVLPPLVQVYYVSNQTSGAFAFSVRTASPGAAFVSIPSGQNAVLFCDGTNVINASTTVAGISSLVMAAGSALSPSLAIGTTDTGLFSAATGEVSVTSSGVQVAGFNSSGLNVNGQIAATNAAGNAAVVVSRPAGSTGAFQLLTGVTPRWSVVVDNSAESGTNAGSNFALTRHNDAGASLGNVLTVVRATGAATVNGAVTLNGPLVVNGRAYTPSVDVAFSATPAFDATLSDVFEFGPLTANVTSLSVTNPARGQSITILFRQDGTGNRTVALPATVKATGALSPGANSRTLLVLTYFNALSAWVGSWVPVPT